MGEKRRLAEEDAKVEAAEQARMSDFPSLAGNPRPTPAVAPRPGTAPISLGRVQIYHDRKLITILQNNRSFFCAMRILSHSVIQKVQGSKT